MEEISVRSPRTAAEWAAYYELRWRVLRAPWHQPQGSERDELEESSVHRMLCGPRGEVLAVGRLHRLDKRRAQIRYMAVKAGYTGKGLGKRILEALEQAATQMDVETIELQARELAVPFYRRFGYQVVEASHLLFDEIQHYLMSKRLVKKSGAD